MNYQNWRFEYYDKNEDIADRYARLAYRKIIGK